MAAGAEDALYRMWPAGRFAEVADRLAEEHGAWIVLVGSKRETGLCDRVISLARRKDRVSSLAGRTSLPGLFALVRGLNLLITNDTGPMHVAAALNKPVVALFGPTEPHRTGPYGRLNEVLQLNLPCSPCFRSRCGRAIEMECLRTLPVPTVWHAVRAQLEATNA